MSFDFTRLEELGRDPLKIIVVGHTCHGKTSTIRTLTKDASFGVVEPGPTLMEGILSHRSHINGRTTFFVYDTPGFENLDDIMFEAQQAGLIQHGDPNIDQLLQFLGTRPGQKEKLVCQTLNEIKNCHIVLMIVDVREPIKEKYKDEIQCMRKSGVPLVVTFNFINESDAKTDLWRMHFKKEGVKCLDFDAHKRLWSHEHELFKIMSVWLEQSLHKEFLESWTSYRSQQAEFAIDETVSTITETVIELAGHTVTRKQITKQNINAKKQEAEQELKTFVMNKQDACLKRIVEAFGFTMNEIDNKLHGVADNESVIGFDLFDASRLKWIATVTGAGTGAAIGGTVDASVGGASFLAGAIIGTIVGGVAGFLAAGAYEYQYDAGSKMITLQPSNAVLTLLIGVGVSTARELKSRGRANPQNTKVRFDKSAFKPTKEALKEIGEFKTRRINPIGLPKAIRQAIEA